MKDFAESKKGDAMKYKEYSRFELENLCIKRRLISESKREACFTAKHLIELLKKDDAYLSEPDSETGRFG